MIATVVGRDAKPCVVRWTGKKGFLSVVTTTYCGDEHDAAAGVTQLPENTQVCPACQRMLAAQ